MYAQIYTHPDLAYVTGMLGRYPKNPGMVHWKGAKKALHYCQGTKDLMLTYRRSDNLEIVAYSDVDLGECVDNRRSTTMLCISLSLEEKFLGKALSKV
jgi:hypothetical protein